MNVDRTSCLDHCEKNQYHLGVQCYTCFGGQYQDEQDQTQCKPCPVMTYSTGGEDC